MLMRICLLAMLILIILMLINLHPDYCVHITFSVYDIWKFNFLPFSVDMIKRLIQVHLIIQT